MAQVRIEDSTGTERNNSPIPLISLEKEQALGATETLARITVNRDDLNDLTIASGRDRVFIEDPAGTDTFGGILRTPGRSGPRPEILGISFAEYMRRAEPVTLGQEKTADDDTLIDEAIDATPELTKGTRENLLSGETFIFSGVTQLKKARTVAEAAGGELVFNPDLSVDYVDTRGTDKTGTTLSPANGSFVENTFTVDRDGASGATTHLRVFGIGQGTHQLEANIVPADESDSFTNQATYVNADWSDGDAEIWDTLPNKDLKNVNALQAWGQTLIEDLQEEEVRVSTVVKGATVELGDEFRIVHPEEGVDEDLRAVEVTKLLGTAGTRYEVIFSNYSVGHRDNVSEQAKDTGRYNLAYEGDWGILHASPGRGPVDSTHDYILKLDYPDDVAIETDAKIVIDGLNYRAYSSGAQTTAATSDTSTTPAPLQAQNSDSDVDVSLTADTENAIDTVTPSNDTQWLQAGVIIENQKSSTVGFNVTVEGTGNFVEYPASGNGGWFFNIESGGRMPLFITIPGNWNGETATIQVEPVGESATIDYISYFKAQGTHTHSVDHSHDPAAGIHDFDGSDTLPSGATATAHYPENVDVVVNGNSEGTSFGDGTGEFHAVHDISNTLTAGENTIALTSDGLGHLDAYVTAEVFRRAL